MEQNPNIVIDESLVGRYLAGEASPEEAIAVDEWRERSAENRARFEELVTLWEQASTGNSWQAPDDTRAWRQLTADLQLPATGRIRNLFDWRLKVAVALLVILGAGVGAWLFLERPVLTSSDQIIRTGPFILSDTLHDQSVITLAQHSRLSVSDGFATTGRQVTLEGEGYFSVKPLSGQPFTIMAGEVKIVVVGTAFNVRQDTMGVTVGVSHGVVKMVAGTDSLLVKAGATGVYERRLQQLHLLDTVDRNEYAYATRVFYFYSTPMEEVQKALEAAYNVQIVFENKQLAHCKLNTQFNQQSLQQVLDVIAASLGIQYRIENSTIYFSGDECK